MVMIMSGVVTGASPDALGLPENGPARDVPATDSRRVQLLEATLAVMVTRGFPDTRIADVAEQAGTSPALVIYYFKTRDQLLIEALQLSERRWYAAGTKYFDSIPTAAGRLEAFVAMSCLPELGGHQPVSLVIWLDLWAQSARHPELAELRREFDARWRRAIAEIVTAGQVSGELKQIDAEDFAIALCAMLDGFAIQNALHDPLVDHHYAFRLTMTYAASQLGFNWTAPESDPAPDDRA
jgi:AcrR family transcriptional regulator